LGAFKAAASPVCEGGLLVFNLKDQDEEEGCFSGLVGESRDEIGQQLDGDGEGDGKRKGISELIRTAVEEGVLSVVSEKRYCHRYSVTGEPL
jgi:hypothetical protein